MSRSCGVFVLATLALCAVLVVVSFRPTPIAGFGADDLASSVNGGGPFAGAGGSCKALGEAWSCTVIETDESSDSNFYVGRYAVEDPTWWGCWTAHRQDEPERGDGLASTLDGCITLLDHF